MPTNITPQDLQQAALKGILRLQHYRNARSMYLKQYVGQYYQSKRGMTGEIPVNLLYNAIRIMVPNLVMQNPKFEVETRYESQQPYGDLLGLGIETVSKDLKLYRLLRQWIVGALFSFGIMKTALKDSDTVQKFDDVEVNNGEVFCEVVDLDDFLLDPWCTKPDFEDAAYIGNLIRVPRQMLLDNDQYDSDLVQKLPSMHSSPQDKTGRAISGGDDYGRDFANKRDIVEVGELWLPAADAIVTIPNPRVMTFDKFLSMRNYYGPDEGQFTFLSFSPPVPGSALPVAPVGVWYDLHLLANRIFRKMADQADRQKDLLVYQPSESDAAQSMIDARDGEVVASNNPQGVQAVSMGGQNSDNEQMLVQVQSWFSVMSGGTEQLGGSRSTAKTATQAELLAAGQAVTIEDAKGILYDKTSSIGRRIGWYLHTDPLINLPMVKRENGKRVYLELTPEQRSGDFLRFVFTTTARSMSRLDPQIKARRMMEFATNILPAAAQAAQVSMQMGTPFNFPRFVIGIAEELGMGDWVAEIFNDEQYMQKMEIMLQQGPQNPGKSGVSPQAIQSNGIKPRTPTQEVRRQEQEPAAVSQAARTVGGGYG